jgi:nucleoside-diphosphate-sugar epimerase
VTAQKRVLVSGAGGFIGRWSVAPLLEMGYEVHAVLSGKAHRHPPVQIRGAMVHVADLLDEARMNDVISEVRPTHLLHLAWIATPGVYWDSAENFRWLSASEQLLRAFRAHGGRRVMMAGSCAEYDWSQVEVCDEVTSPLLNASASPYAASKIALQKSLAEFGWRERVSTAWGRIFFQFGPHEHPDRLVPSVISNLLSNREAPVSHGRQIRSFLHVADVGAAFAAVLDGAIEGPVNIGSDERVSVADLVDRIGRSIGRSDLLRIGARAAAPREPKLLVPDIHRLRDEARWRPRFTLDAGLDDTIAWWRGNLGSAGGAASHG